MCSDVGEQKNVYLDQILADRSGRLPSEAVESILGGDIWASAPSMNYGWILIIRSFIDRFAKRSDEAFF